MDKIEALRMRIRLLENVVDHVVKTLAVTQPEFVKENLDEIYARWDKQEDELIEIEKKAGLE